jgi:hypothetical protein
MPEIKFSISEELLERMKKFPEINLKKVAHSAVEKYLDKLEIANKLASKSNFTLEDADELGETVKQEIWKKHKYYLKPLKNEVYNRHYYNFFRIN